MMTQLSILLNLRAIHFIGQACTKKGNHTGVSQLETAFFLLLFFRESFTSSLWDILFLASSASTIGPGSICALQASVQLCAHVSVAHYVTLINLITVQHAHREREDGVEALITLCEGVSM